MNPTDAIDRTITSKEDALIDLRRHFHAHPELSREEHETTRELAHTLEEQGLRVTVSDDGLGLYADLEPAGGFDPTRHRTVAIRSDIDALAIVEETGLPFASQNPGVMHACGHDMHIACVTGAALALTDLRADLPGRLRFVYQHAEEVAPGGALDMVRAGVMEGVDRILGLHCDPTMEVGTVGVRVGPFTAAADSFDLTIQGTGGHSARPHEGVDTVFVATRVIGDLYQAASRLFDARSPIVIAVGSIHGGQTYNVIPDQVALKGTVRSLDPNYRLKLRELFEQITAATCATYGATYTLRFKHGAPAVINDARVTDVIARVASDLLGPDAVHTIPLPSMGAEDFSEFLQVVPGAMFRLGTLTPGAESHFLHSPRFNPDERAIAVGARILARAALRLLSETS